MANEVKAPGGTHELRTRYAQTIVKLIRKKNVLRENHSGRDYEGDPRAGSIKIPVRNTEVEVQNYNVATGADLKQSETTYKQVLVDRHKAINELIDGYEAAAVPDNIVAQRLESGAFSIARQLELDFINKMVSGGSIYNNYDELTDETAYSTISKMVGEMSEKGFSKDQLRIVVTSGVEGMLLEDKKYINTSSNFGSERVQEGVVGKLRGVDVLISDNLPDDKEAIVYSPDFVQTGQEFMVEPAINQIMNGEHIGASVLQGRMVYWNEVTNSEGVLIKSSKEIGDLTVASTEGDSEGETNISISPEKEDENNVYYYKIEENEGDLPEVEYGTDVSSWDKLETLDNKDVGAAKDGHYIKVVEASENGKKAFKKGTTQLDVNEG